MMSRRAVSDTPRQGMTMVGKRADSARAGGSNSKVLGAITDLGVQPSQS
jgi:hypothetical protein